MLNLENFNNIIKRLYNISINIIENIKILPDTRSVTFITTDNGEFKYIFTESGLKTLFIFIYYYTINTENGFYILCEQTALIINDLDIQNYEHDERCSIIYERYGILKSIKYYK